MIRTLLFVAKGGNVYYAPLGSESSHRSQLPAAAKEPESMKNPCLCLERT